MDDYANYEADSKKIIAANKKLLSEFKIWLQSSNLSEKTINNHISNISFYINEYLLYYEEPIKAQDGIGDVSTFLGDWFIRKAMWASKAHIKSNAASITKFYTFLLGKGLVTSTDLNELKSTIKAELPEWIQALKRYDDLGNEDMDNEW
jgi:hypothetical protein